jgi:hypothetical protein
LLNKIDRNEVKIIEMPAEELKEIHKPSFSPKERNT